VLNPFTKAGDTAKYLKIAATGPSGSGKTVFGLDAKNHGMGPVFVFSLEAGEVLYETHPQWGGFSHIRTNSIEKLEEGLDYLETLTGGTVVVDTATGIYEGLVEGSKRNGSFAHGVTYAGHPVASAVAVEALKIYEERDIAGHVRAVSPRFLARVHALDAHPLVAGTRGVGLIGAIELVRDKDARAPFDPTSGVQARLAEAVLEEGLITRSLRDTVAFCPPLIITEPQVDEMFDKFERALDTTLAFARSKSLVD
jgi:hypothetical protein